MYRYKLFRHFCLASKKKKRVWWAREEKVSTLGFEPRTNYYNVRTSVNSCCSVSLPSFLSGVQKKKGIWWAREKKSLDTRIRTKDQQITTVTTTVCRSTGLSYVELKSAADFRHVVAHFYDISILYIFICVMPTPEVLV